MTHTHTMTQPTGDPDTSTTHITADTHTTPDTPHHTTHHTTTVDTTGELVAASEKWGTESSVVFQQILMFNSKHLCINFILNRGQLVK